MIMRTASVLTTPAMTPTFLVLARDESLVRGALLPVALPMSAEVGLGLGVRLLSSKVELGTTLKMLPTDVADELVAETVADGVSVMESDEATDGWTVESGAGLSVTDGGPAVVVGDENICANGEGAEVENAENAEDGDRDGNGDEVVAELEVVEKVVEAGGSEVIVDRLLESVVRTVDEVSDKLEKSVKEAEEADEPKENEEADEATEVDGEAEKEAEVSTEVEDDGADVVADVAERL
ncbi:hypothetical protein HETIRDRAFT_410548 [Heterobasidion irregulare TC 32-1]|uniref:Uncharacterized protein n=1 Tax=Heterobasidion irregulare (strain TC 32-1) TaxID=747525 RepID=W4K2Q9_HETIT|nr:uncharacterized protein HETIRDRAFT_410548 [Heterobasidion irregulare TC 32-1]ETW80019.1 hypothetical protein HETIRDRAFT_410548 [Heterobasidion irregulare TC 32-1]